MSGACCAHICIVVRRKRIWNISRGIWKRAKEKHRCNDGQAKFSTSWTARMSKCFVRVVRHFGDTSWFILGHVMARGCRLSACSSVRCVLVLVSHLLTPTANLERIGSLTVWNWWADNTWPPQHSALCNRKVKENLLVSCHSVGAISVYISKFGKFFLTLWQDRGATFGPQW